MYLDFEDHRPETPRVPSVISVREGVLLSLVFHLLVLVFILVAPSEWFKASPEQAVPDQSKEPLRYVQIMPAIDRAELAKRLAEQSDQDRVAATRERAPLPENAAPFSRGNTPEKIEGAPEMSAAGPEAPTPPAPAAAPPAPSTTATNIPLEPQQTPSKASGNMGQALRNLQRYLQNETFDNQHGGDSQQSADIQFDSKGVDFGPWLRRFTNQIRRNWLIPQVAEMAKGRVVITFSVMRNGAIVDLRIAQPAGIEALTISALTALKLSNPTSALPSEYPDDRVQFTVTFHYNEGLRDGQ